MVTYRARWSARRRGLINGLMVAYGQDSRRSSRRLAMLAAARGLAEIIANRQTQIIRVKGFLDVFTGDLLGIPMLVWIFVVVAVAGWILLNRTTFGRRTFAVGGNPEAARLAGIKVKRHTMFLYGLVGLSAGIAGGDDHGAHHGRHRRPTAPSTSSTRSPPWSSAAPCCPAAAAPSSAPSSAC